MCYKSVRFVIDYVVSVMMGDEEKLGNYILKRRFCPLVEPSCFVYFSIQKNGKTLGEFFVGLPIFIFFEVLVKGQCSLFRDLEKEIIVSEIVANFDYLSSFDERFRLLLVLHGFESFFDSSNPVYCCENKKKAAKDTVRFLAEKDFSFLKNIYFELLEKK